MAANDYTVAQRLTTETKSSFKTSEMFIYLAVVIGIIITANVVGNDGDKGDAFRALDAVRYITYATVGYLVSRGLAKAGSREPFWDKHEVDTRATTAR
ncbi:MAG: sle [Thermoleophilia bacterium]|nr:sle [Thermoleophilia bacterium]